MPHSLNGKNFCIRATRMCGRKKPLRDRVPQNVCSLLTDEASQMTVLPRRHLKSVIFTMMVMALLTEYVSRSSLRHVETNAMK